MIHIYLWIVSKYIWIVLNGIFPTLSFFQQYFLLSGAMYLQVDNIITGSHDGCVLWYIQVFG